MGSEVAKNIEMCWGDAKLKETADGKEYLELIKEKPKQEPVQTAAISRKCHLKCLPLMDQKKIL